MYYLFLLPQPGVLNQVPRPLHRPGYVSDLFVFAADAFPIAFSPQTPASVGSRTNRLTVLAFTHMNSHRCCLGSHGGQSVDCWLRGRCDRHVPGAILFGHFAWSSLPALLNLRSCQAGSGAFRH